MSKDIKGQIEQIIDNIYKYDINKAMSLIEGLLVSIDISMGKNEFQDIDQLNRVLIVMENAMNNKDYLLLADILKFEMLSIIPSKYLN